MKGATFRLTWRAADGVIWGLRLGLPQIPIEIVASGLSTSGDARIIRVCLSPHRIGYSEITPCPANKPLGSILVAMPTEIARKKR